MVRKMEGRKEMTELLVVKEELASNYRHNAPERLRANAPAWHVPPVNNLQYLTNITVRIRQGQGERLDQKLKELRASGNHLLPGTSARYIVRSQSDPDEVQIMLVWRSAIMPPEEEREAALDALRAALAEILSWETAVRKESRVVMHS